MSEQANLSPQNDPQNTETTGESLLAVNAELERRVEELTRQLRSANEELLRNSAAKDVFLATLSHELRTPLTPIVGWARVLLTNSTPAMIDKGLHVIERNALHQARLIEDLLDIFRIITGRISFNPKYLDLRLVAESAIKTVHEKASEKEIRLTVNAPADAVIVYGVEMRLEQIIWNLLTNAIKFTENGGCITLAVEAINRDARITVSDTGIGISAEFLPHVFERFKQAEWFEKRKHDGLGLGLSIVEGLVELHHGHVTVESQGIGHGASFAVTLPLASPVTAEPAAQPSLEKRQATTARTS